MCVCSGGNGLAGSFDAVTCNPPYSRTTAPATDSLQKEWHARELTCTLEDAVGCAARLLRASAEGWRLCIRRSARQRYLMLCAAVNWSPSVRGLCSQREQAAQAAAC